MCDVFGAKDKDAIIYELEMLGAVFSISFWREFVTDCYTVCSGDNEAARFALIKGTAQGAVGRALVKNLLRFEKPNTPRIFGSHEFQQKPILRTLRRVWCNTLFFWKKLVCQAMPENLSLNSSQSSEQILGQPQFDRGKECGSPQMPK